MLDYIALGILIFTATSLLFGAIAILGIPHKIAVDRNHPHQDAIYYAGWVSLFTLHAIWPLLWIWSAVYRKEPGPKLSQVKEDTSAKEDTAKNDKAVTKIDEADSGVWQVEDDITDSVTLLRHRLEALDDRIKRIEKAIMGATEAA
jgi:hypothetical protein